MMVVARAGAGAVEGFPLRALQRIGLALGGDEGLVVVGVFEGGAVDGEVGGEGVLGGGVDVEGEEGVFGVEGLVVVANKGFGGCGLLLVSLVL